MTLKRYLLNRRYIWRRERNWKQKPFFLIWSCGTRRAEWRNEVGGGERLSYKFWLGKLRCPNERRRLWQSWKEETMTILKGGDYSNDDDVGDAEWVTCVAEERGSTRFLVTANKFVVCASGRSVNVRSNQFRVSKYCSFVFHNRSQLCKLKTQQ